jgi:hypothetical protein
MAITIFKSIDRDLMNKRKLAMPFMKEFSDKIQAIREVGLVVLEFNDVATYSEIKITSKSGGVYVARIGFLPVIEKSRDEIAGKIGAYMDKSKWNKE